MTPPVTNRAERRRRRGGRAVAVAAAVVVATGAVTAAAIGFGGSGGDTPAATNLPPGTVQVTRQTMLDTDDVTGRLGYSAQTTLAGRVEGIVTKVPLAGDVIGRGKPIYRVDNQPIVLMFGDIAAYRTLGPGVSGRDARQLEDNLEALGYGGFTVDDTYTASTANAVKRWQKDQGLPLTGQVELGRIVFAPGEIRIDSIAVGVSQSTGGGDEVLQYTGTGRQVTAELQVSEQRLAREGSGVQIQMPDGKTVAGRVERVYTVVEEPQDSGAEPQTLINAVISLGDPTAGVGVEAAVVTVVFTADERKDVLSVPIAALVALSEGGYGVEVVDGETTHYIRVQTGIFANGRVEISGDGLREGMTVGMPG